MYVLPINTLQTFFGHEKLNLGWAQKMYAAAATMGMYGSTWKASPEPDNINRCSRSAKDTVAYIHACIHTYIHTVHTYVLQFIDA